MIGIYKITNKINGKSYVGQSTDIERRWREHHYRYWNNDNVIYMAFRKYGIENFDFSIIEECSTQELNSREEYWINYYDSYYNGYNETVGGDGSSGNSIKLSKDSILQIIDLLLNSDLTQREIAKRFDVTDETISEINRGKTRVQDGLNYPLRDRVKRKIIYAKNNDDTFQNKKFSISTQAKFNRCIDCGMIIGPKSTRCNKCRGKTQRVIERPSAEQLQRELFETNFEAVARKYGVSSTSIRKWCASYDLPTHAADYKIKKEKSKHQEPASKYAAAYTKKGEFVNEFSSYTDAARWIVKIGATTSKELEKVASNIGRAVDQKSRATAYGYVWYSKKI